MEKLVTSSFLKPYQKYNIVNGFIFPSLIYPLQTIEIASNAIGIYLNNAQWPQCYAVSVGDSII